MPPFSSSQFNKPAQRTGTGLDAPVDEAGRTQLHLSVESGDMVAIARLLKQGANPRQPDGNGQTPLYAAIAAHNTDLIEFLVKHGASFRDADDDGNTPLQWAIEMKSDVAFVEKLHGLGATLDFQGESGGGALRAAAAGNNIDVLTWLLKNRTSVDAADAGGKTALHNAVQNGAHEAMQLLLDNGADPLLRTRELKTPLYFAAEKGDAAAADILLALPDVSRTLNDHSSIVEGFTPLMAAVASRASNNDGHVAVAEKLLDHGAYINKLDNQNRHSLFIAVEMSTPAMVALLIRRGADVEKAPLFGDQKLSLVHRIGPAGYREKLLLLAQAGANVNAKDTSGNTPLHIATDVRDAAKVRALLEAGANPNLANNFGRRPLDRAVEMAQWSNEEGATIVAALLAANANPNIAPSEMVQYAPLHIAARSNQPKLVKLLLAHGAIVDVPDRSTAGETPWLAAVTSGNLEAVDMLRQKGADTTVKDKNGRTVLHAAAQSGAASLLQAALNDPAFRGQVNTPDVTGTTPLHAATSSYRTESIATLLKAGADLFAYDSTGMTPIHYLVRSSIEQMYDLYDKALGANKNAWNIQSKGELQTPLHMAAKDGYTNSIELLLKRGVDVTLKNARGHTALMSAIVAERGWAVKSLAEGMKRKNVSLDAARDNNGFAPLHLAVSAQYSAPQSTQALLDAGADINLRTITATGIGDTPLLIAIARGRADIVQVLLARGADPALAGQTGVLPIDLARAQNRQDIVTAIQNEMMERQKKLAQQGLPPSAFRRRPPRP
jgi:serine/threonine-protein phosphatase 6 regulatory ankyrin repeat subunit B